MSEISEASLFEENQCVKVDFSSRSTSSESSASSFTNEIFLSSPKEPLQYGDVNIEQSQNVHLGQKNLYENCNIRVVNYLQDLSELSNYLKESSEFENKLGHFQKSHTGVESKFKLWIRKDIGQTTIIVGGFLLLIIASVFLAIFLDAILISITVLNSNETTTLSSAIETTTFDYENISTSPIPTTTNAPKSKCPSAYEFLKSKMELASNPEPRYYRIISREAWNASAFEYEGVKLEMSEYVIVSHTLQRPCLKKNLCIERVQKLQNFDRIERKLDDIRYNFLIGGEGNIYEGRGWDVVGQHTDGYNNRSLGIAFIGDFNKYYHSVAQIYSFKSLLEQAVENKKLIEDYKLIGRCQVIFSTDSPGKSVYQLVSTENHWIPDPLGLDKN